MGNRDNPEVLAFAFTQKPTAVFVRYRPVADIRELLLPAISGSALVVSFRPEVGDLEDSLG